MYSLADDDKLHEECGVFGIFTPDNKDAKHSLYYGLCALQHRGQESAGMAPAFFPWTKRLFSVR